MRAACGRAALPQYRAKGANHEARSDRCLHDKPRGRGRQRSAAQRVRRKAWHTGQAACGTRLRSLRRPLHLGGITSCFTLISSSGKIRLSGEAATFGAVLEPAPLKLTVIGAALLAIVRLPPSAPVTVGVKVTAIAQVIPGASAAPAPRPSWHVHRARGSGPRG